MSLRHPPDAWPRSRCSPAAGLLTVAACGSNAKATAQAAKLDTLNPA